MENTVIRIGGMSCQGCVTNISGILSGLAGVANAEVSLSENLARVQFDAQKVDREALVAAIEDAGFDAE
jgi:copper chaperone